MERAETGRGWIGAGIDGSDKEVGESKGFKEEELATTGQADRTGGMLDLTSHSFWDSNH